MVQNIVGPYRLLCFTLALRERGCTTEEIGAFIRDSVHVPFPWLPGWLVQLLKRPVFWLTFRKLASVAEQSQRREHPDEFVVAVPSSPGDSAYKLEIHDCAVCKAFAKHGEESVVPYICATDDVVSDAIGLGLRRTGTRALGAECCDFRYELGGEPLRLEDQYDLAEGKRLTGE